MRLKILSLTIFSAFFILVFSLFWMQVMRGGYYFDLSQNNRIRLIPQEAPRGNIFDAKGRLLADNTLSYDLVIRPQDLSRSQDSAVAGKNNKEKDFIISRLAVLLGTSVDSLKALYKKNFVGPFRDVIIAKDISKDTAFKFEQMNLQLPAVKVLMSPRRRYIDKEATSAILGFLGEIDKDELTVLKDYGYRRQDLIGKAGIEKLLDIALKGEDGGTQIEVNNRGYQASVLSQKTQKIGKDVRLTIDIDVQEYAYGLLGGRKGAIVVLDPNSGRIISMVSSPGFDPNLFVSGESKDSVRALLNDEATPLLNRVVQGQYPPGSIFKIVTAVAGLETKKILDSATTFYCPGFYSFGGRRFGCWEEKGHGRLDLKGALEHSCNVFFFKAGEKIRQEQLGRYAYMFGLGRTSGVDLEYRVRGFVPDKNWKRRVIGENWYDGDTLNLSIGQGYVMMTPLQAVVMVSAIANNAKLVRPYLIESVGEARAGAPRVWPLPISHNTIRIIQDALKRVVQSPSGTGILARVDGLSVAGKTGTAQLKSQASHAWFVGYAPSDNPKAAIVVFLENGGYGGETAAPIASAVFKKMKTLGLL